MNYLVTCVCGQQFMVSAAQLGRHATCPGCNRALIPLAAEQRAGDTTAPANEPATLAEPTKRCPYCGECILAVAKKCRYCGEFLDRDRAAAIPAVTSTAPGAAPATTTRAVAAADEPAPAFQLCVSQWDNFWKYLTCVTITVLTVFFVKIGSDHLLVIKDNALMIIISVVLLTAITAYFFYLSNRTARCMIWPTRIDTESGVFSKKRESLELSRVADVEIKQGIIERILGFGTILLTTNNESQPTMELYQIPKARKVYKYLQQQAGKVQVTK